MEGGIFTAINTCYTRVAMNDFTSITRDDISTVLQVTSLHFTCMLKLDVTSQPLQKFNEIGTLLGCTGNLIARLPVQAQD
jgi:hypothetical protein